VNELFIRLKTFLDNHFDVLNVACQGLIVLLLLTAGIFSYWIARKYFLKWFHLLVSSTNSRLDDALIEHKVVHRVCLLLPLIIMYAGAGLIVPQNEELKAMVERISLSIIIIVAARVLDAVMNAGMAIHSAVYGSQEHPDTFFVHALKALVYISAILVSIVTLTNQSFTTLLTGLGAMSALLLLVFRDVLLGFVAGIQLRSKDLIRKGDRIIVSKYAVEGTVIEVGLNSVIIQNADKAYINIPNYVLVSESFTNLRGVTEVGGQRIKRAIKIDLNSIGFCTPEMLAHLQKISLIADYLREKTAQVQGTEDTLDGISNLDVFRRYVQAYLKAHPKINSELPFFVRQLAPTETGVGIEVSVFSRERDSAAFEELQAEIFDHLFSVLKQFQLRMYQAPSGHDFGLKASAGP
jgi:miniconductance mechanosensitive channel